MTRRLALLVPLALLLAGCGARPQQAVGVSRGPTVRYLLCPGERVRSIRLTTPAGRVVWRIDSARGSPRTAYRVGAAPAGFRTVVPFRGLPALTRVSGQDGKPVMQFARPPATGVLRGDGRRVGLAAFEAERGSYCDGVRRERAAALAVGFAFLVLALLFASRWLRAKRTRNPYDRPWRSSHDDG